MRKNYKKLLRSPYDFGTDTNKPSADDTESIIQDCECEGNPGLDPNPGSCFVDEYTFCGSAGVDTTVDLDELPTYYLRVTSSPEPNPEVIFIPSFGEGGGCFRKGDQVACEDSSGILLGMEDYYPLPTSDDDPACDNPPCAGPNCPFLRLTLCTNDPSYPNVTPFEIVLPVSYFGGFGLGYKVVKYDGHCYETPTVPCMAAPYESATIPNFNEIEVITTNGCENDECQCCADVMARMDLLNIGIQERLKLLNNGSLPGGVDPDHDWDDPDYILHSESVEVANGNTEETDCADRYETWRLWLVEINYWLLNGTGFDLYQNSVGSWIDTTVHVGAEIEGASYPLSFFDATDYQTLIADLDWFDNTFGENTTTQEFFTYGDVSTFGTTDAIRFFDSDPHVVVNEGDAAWCNLVNATVDAMMTAIQQLTALMVGASAFVDDETKNTSSSSTACIQAKHPTTAWGAHDDYDALCVLNSSGAIAGSASALCFSTGRAEAYNGRAKIQFDLGDIGADYVLEDPRLFLKMDDFSGNIDQLGQTKPIDQPFNTYGEWVDGSAALTVGAVCTTGYVTGSDVDPITYTDLTTIGWNVSVGIYARIMGLFTV